MFRLVLNFYEIQQSESLASLGIMGPPLRTLLIFLKHQDGIIPQTSKHHGTESLRVSLNLVLIMPRDISLSDAANEKKIILAIRETEINFTAEFQTRKTTAIRRLAARETSDSRHHGGIIEGIPKTSQNITALSY